MDDIFTLVGVGTIKFGEVTAHGTWKTEDGLLQIAFETKALVHQTQLNLERYRSSSEPFTICLPDHQQPIVGFVIGFERGTHETFYIARVQEAPLRAPSHAPSSAQAS